MQFERRAQDTSSRLRDGFLLRYTKTVRKLGSLYSFEKKNKKLSEAL